MKKATFLSFVSAWFLTPFSSAQFVEPLELIHEFAGVQDAERFGSVVVLLADCDGDGVNDLGIGAPRFNNALGDEGRFDIYSGTTGDLIRSHMGQPGSFLGASAASVGDLTGDGVDDYLIGAPAAIGETFGNPDLPGQVMLYSGETGDLLHTWTGEANGDRFGMFLSGAGSRATGGAGDVDADGTVDFIIAAPGFGGLNDATEIGRVYIISGDDFQAIYNLTGNLQNGEFAQAIAGLGDLNEDTHAEFLIGASSEGPQRRGAAYVYDGKTGGLLFGKPTLSPGPNPSEFGAHVSGFDDLDHDGVLDFYIADTLGGADIAGEGFIFSGATGKSLLPLKGEDPGQFDIFGVSSPAGDVNDDGFADILIASPNASQGAANSGKAELFSGKDGTVLRSFISTVVGDRLAYALETVGDLNADGQVDFALATPHHGAPNRGHVWVIAGRSSSCIADLDADGDLDAKDFFLFLDAFAAMNADVCDLDFDGDCDAEDFFGYLDLFASGCD